MILPENHYPDYSSVNTLESLILTFARAILITQRNSSFNSDGLDYIDFVTNEESQSCSINVGGLRARIDESGLISVNNPFNATINPGTGSYPFNRTNLLDAFFHCCCFAQKLESDSNFNLSDTAYFSVSISSQAVKSNYSLDVKVDISDFPLNSTVLPDGTVNFEAKEYLFNQ